MNGEAREVRDVMIDLETMGVNTKAAIVAIGAVGMDVINNKVIPGSEFYCIVDLESSVQNEGIMDASTVLWWLSQSDFARSTTLSKPAPLPHTPSKSHWFM